MITGFNPADMYAADHIRRVLETFPGVFTGIGEFTIHKEFVSAKIAGGPGEPRPTRRSIAFSTSPARSASSCCSTATSTCRSPSRTRSPYHARADRRALPAPSRRRPSSGRTPASAAWCVRSRTSSRSSSARSTRSGATPTSTSTSPGTRSPSTSWRVPSRSQATAALINQYPDRFLFGTDEVAPDRSEAST